MFLGYGVLHSHPVSVSSSYTHCTSAGSARGLAV
jgi:hypothetical protein